MSTSPLTSSLLSQIAGSPSAANQFVTDLNQLSKDLQSGNLSAAQNDFVTLSEDALNGVTLSSSTSSASGISTSLLSAIASSSSASSSFVSDLNQLGADLQNGDLGSAQQDLLSLDSTALSAGSSAGTTGTSSTASSSSTANQAEIQKLIQAVVQALGAGDSSAAGTVLSELASVSGNSQGATALENLGQSLGSGSSSSSTSSISQLLQSVDGSSSSSSSLLNELA